MGDMRTYKSDWDEARQRLCDFWAGKPTDRVLASVLASRETPGTTDQIDRRLPEKFTDPDTVFRNLDIRLANTFWGGEAVPCHFVYLGAMFSVTFLGAEPKFHDGGAWYDSPYAGWEDADRMHRDPENRWWKLFCGLARRSAERSGGRYFTTVGGICASLDVFAELFGTEETLLAMADDADGVKHLRDIIIEWGKDTYNHVRSLVSPHQDGFIDWMQVWAPDTVRSVQCDLSVAISPGMFEEFVQDEIREFLSHVEYGIYHLDGEDQIKHLDLLLAIEPLDMIQFVPVTKPTRQFPRDPMLHIDLFRRILEGGKRAFIYCPPERIEPLLNAIPHQGVYLCVSGCREEKVARDVLRTLDRIGM